MQFHSMARVSDREPSEGSSENRQALFAARFTTCIKRMIPDSDFVADCDNLTFPAGNVVVNDINN